MTDKAPPVVLPAVLTIAGSDPSGGAGIQGDLKTFHQQGVYGSAVITLLTVQNTLGISRVECLPAELVADQLRAVLADIEPIAVKTGALGNAEIIRSIAGELSKRKQFLTVDPVMISKHGSTLLSDDSVSTLCESLLPLADLLTPNLSEARTFAKVAGAGDFHGDSLDEMTRLGEMILKLGVRAVLVKGGHRRQEPSDVFVSKDDVHIFEGVRISSKNTHGTGCTLSAAITACVAKGESVQDAILIAKSYVTNAIRTAPAIGAGIGPLNHFAR